MSANGYPCRFPGCPETVLVWYGTGRPRDYCDDHRDRAARQVDAMRMAQRLPVLEAEAAELRRKLATVEAEAEDLRRQLGAAEWKAAAAEEAERDALRRLAVAEAAHAVTAPQPIVNAI